MNLHPQAPATLRRSLAVVGLGHCNWDYLSIVDTMPQWDSPGTIPIHEFVSSGGGPVSTALVTLARLGIDCGYIGCLGDDDLGDNCVRGLLTENVDITRLRVQAGARSRVTVVLVHAATGRRSFMSHDGNTGLLHLDEEDRRYLTGARFLHLDGHQIEAAIQAARWMRTAGGTVVLDAYRPRPGLEDLIPLVDVLIANESFPTVYTGRPDLAGAAKVLLACGPRLVVATLSERGCVCFTHDSQVQVPGFSVPVVDTTGAGDAFHGAFIYGLLQGWDTVRVALFSNAVGAINCTALGGRTALPSRAQVDEFLRARAPGWI